MMKRFLLLMGILPGLLTGRGLLALDAKAVAGNYELQNVPEIAGMLSLKADGKYQAGFSYGAADWVEEGTWRLEASTLVLADSRVQRTNYQELQLFLPAGSRFEYSKGKLRLIDAQRRVVFIEPNRNPDGEGRMTLKGEVVRLDADYLVLRSEGECKTAAVIGLSEKTLQAVKGKVGKTVKVEVPYSAMLGAGSCE